MPGPRMQDLLDTFNAYKARIDGLLGIEHVPLADLRGRPLVTLREEMAKVNTQADTYVAALPVEAKEEAKVVATAQLEVAADEAVNVETK